jgi:hypothetical protein
MSVSDMLTKANVSMVVGACTLVFLVFLFLDNRYFHSEAADNMQTQIAGALNEQMKMQNKFYTDQQKINDMRQLDQLRTSKALLETELRRSPNDRLLREKLGIIDGQIRFLEAKLLNP